MNILEKIDKYLEEACPGDKIKSKGKGKGMGKGKGKGPIGKFKDDENISEAMSKEEAIAKFKKTKQLSTDILEPLGISFESFLKFAQLSHNDPKQADSILKQLAKKLGA